MLDKLDQALRFHSRALVLRAERQQSLASNIANADTPGYKATDFNFADALNAATGMSTNSGSAPRLTHANHMTLAGVAGASTPELLYRTPTQPSIDNNTVDMDLERAQFADNAIRYEATLRFLSSQIRSILAAVNTNS